MGRNRALTKRGTPCRVSVCALQERMPRTFARPALHWLDVWEVTGLQLQNGRCGWNDIRCPSLPLLARVASTLFPLHVFAVPRSRLYRTLIYLSSTWAYPAIAWRHPSSAPGLTVDDGLLRKRIRRRATRSTLPSVPRSQIICDPVRL